MSNPFRQLQKLYQKPQLVPAEVTQVRTLTPEDKKLLQRIGLTVTQVRRDLLKDIQIQYDRMNLYHQCERACLSGETRVWLLDGTTPAIQEMAENPGKYIGKYVLTINPITLELEPDEIVKVDKTRTNSKLIKIHLDNNKSVKCTPDHLFMLRSGVYKKAEELQPGDSLMPLYFKYPNEKSPLKDYLLVYRPNLDKYSFVHRLVAKFLDSSYVVSRGKVPHHVDFNKLNNDPSNIQVMGSKEHKQLHGNINRKKHNIATCKCYSCRAIRGETKGKNSSCYEKHPWNYNLTKETDPRLVDISKHLCKKSKKACQECGKEFFVPPSRANAKYCSRKCANAANSRNLTAIESRSKAQKKRYQNPQEYQKQLEHLKEVHEKNRKPKEKRVCPECGVVFEVSPGWKKEFCSSKCANKNVGQRWSTIIEHAIAQTELWCNKEYRERQLSAQKSGGWNHKVVSVEELTKREDTYDIATKKNHNFPLEIGIFVHNSEHPLVAAAAELYASYCTVMSPLHGNSTAWITSESSAYQRELTKLLDRIGIEEKIFDWAYTTGTYGDMFVKINGIPGTGIISVDDDEHPLNTSRVDHEGILVGYYKTPMGQIAEKQNLIPPWEYVHFRLLGGKKKRPRFCLEGNTRIKLLNGTTPTIQEMAENLDKYIGKSVLSINPENRKLEYDTIVNAQKTRLNAELVRVHLDNGKYVDATEDHRFMLRSGAYRKAEELQPGDSLMPLYTKINEKIDGLVGYEMVFDLGKNKKGIRGGFVFTHRIPFSPKQKKGYVIHHKDFNPLNNDLENLVRITKEEHVVAHRGNLDEQKRREAKRLTTIEKKRQDPEYEKKLLEKRIGRGTWEIRTCALPGCNNTFACSIKDTKKYCGPVCVHIALKKPKSEEHKQHMRKPKSAEHAKHVAEGRKKALAKKKEEQGFAFIPWNYGLTKETDPRVAKNAESTSRALIGKKRPEGAGQKAAFSLKGHPNFRDPNYVCGTWRKNRLQEVINHKVVKVEWLKEKKDTYDLTTKKNHNFPLDIGIFVHNSDPMYTEFRTMHLLTGMDIKQVTTKYGTSLLFNALPAYRRLRMAEDSLLLARLSRGLIRYVWKLKVTHSSLDAVADLVDQYAMTLREARALNTKSTEPFFEEKENPMAVMEDIFLPVWGEVGDLTYEKIGGETDIRWIKDIERLEQQLSAALRVPLPLLGANLEQATGALGSQAIEKLDINFARAARRLQRAVRNGIKRICQIHLAWRNMDPDPNLFDVEMPEMSTAEEESLRESLDKGTDVINKFLEMAEKIEEEGGRKIDRIELANYLNQKFLKLEDFDWSEFISSTESIPECKRRKERKEQEAKVKQILEEARKSNGKKDLIERKSTQYSNDLFSFVPTIIHDEEGKINEDMLRKVCEKGGWLGKERCKHIWEGLFSKTRVIEGDIDKDVELQGQKLLPFSGK